MPGVRNYSGRDMKEGDGKTGNNRNLPVPYLVIKLGGMIGMTVSLVIVASWIVVSLARMFKLPGAVSWLVLPLLFFLLPAVMLFYNFTCHSIPALRNYFDRVHRERGLPGYSRSTKELSRVMLCALPSLAVAVLVGVLAVRGVPENITGPAAVASTLLAGIGGLALASRIMK